MKLGSIYAKKNKKAINIIPNTKENYITMSVNVVVDQYEQQYQGVKNVERYVRMKFLTNVKYVIQKQG